MRRNILKGFAGKALAKTIENRFKKVDYKLLTEPFFLRSEDDRAWRGEFWGKVIRPAITCAFLTGDPGLRALIDDSVADMMKTQTSDGSISTYPDDQKLTAWDIWGRKYAILGLIRYYELLDHDPKVLACCCKAVDHLISQMGNTPLIKFGKHGGLPASSILGAVVSLWRLTGEQKYRDFAGEIIAGGCSDVGNIYECSAAGVPPALLGTGKAYEMTSCFQGLAELALLEKNDEWKEIVYQYWKDVRDQEIFITGTGGAKDTHGEFWFSSALRQTRSDCGGLGETCVTVTWMRYCLRILELTDDPRAADEIEKSLYNALLGAWGRDGVNWVHANPTPLTGGGYKKFADDQILRAMGQPFGGNDCCKAQGPEGFAIASEMAVMGSENRVTVNLFEPLESETLQISGNYPVDPRAEITFKDPEDKMLRLRTPAFLKAVKVNGVPADFRHGVYLEIPHRGGCTDTVELEFDFSLREIPSPDGRGFTAVMRGPLVLAEDSRGEVPEAAVTEKWRGKTLVEYAVAGNLNEPGNTLTVWFKGGEDQD